MFMAFDHLSNSANNHQQQLFQSHNNSSSFLFSGLMEIQQQRDVTRLLEAEAEADDEKKDSSVLCEAGESGSIDVQSCDDTTGIMKQHHRQKLKQAAAAKKIKKHRYAFQTRSHVDILDDGYRWRKYGQKAVKNNKFPRSYYRCTHQGCNVKKQVQRLSKDETIVITTYEGVHSHPIQKSTDNFEHILTQMQIYNTSASSI
ncbi:unnamed protein product [Rhodiola kirilowii]